MLVAASAATAPWAAGRTPRAGRAPDEDDEVDPLLAGAGWLVAAAPDPLVLALLHATNVPATARAAVAPAKSRMALLGIRVVMSFL
jgi:hypothetical protein